MVFWKPTVYHCIRLLAVLPKQIFEHLSHQLVHGLVEADGKNLQAVARTASAMAIAIRGGALPKPTALISRPLPPSTRNSAVWHRNGMRSAVPWAGCGG